MFCEHYLVFLLHETGVQITYSLQITKDGIRQTQSP